MYYAVISYFKESRETSCVEWHMFPVITAAFSGVVGKDYLSTALGLTNARYP
jgi:hypothetical protein